MATVKLGKWSDTAKSLCFYLYHKLTWYTQTKKRSVGQILGQGVSSRQWTAGDYSSLIDLADYWNV
jgi:hypothetical protein